MNISVCITVLNEERTIAGLLDSLLDQSKKASEIVVVDGGSEDNTVEIIRHYQKRFGGIKLLVQKCSRAQARNLGVEIAKGEVVAMTDAGCVAQKDWLKKITGPFFSAQVDAVAGFYRMTAKTFVGRAMSIFLGVTPAKFNCDFLPSTRSMAFTKKIWEEVGGFPEELNDTAEDTVFNYKLVKNGAKVSRVKDAIVEWGMPESISRFQLAIFRYAKGDARSKIWVFPKKGLASHNIKAIFILLRYIAGFVLLILSFKYKALPYLIALLLAYFYWSFRKVFLEFPNWRVAVWGPILQIVSDLGVMKGFVVGLFGQKKAEASR
jgi:glycosyltransferase involved in cell wall biosynthesis